MPDLARLFDTVHQLASTMAPLADQVAEARRREQARARRARASQAARMFSRHPDLMELDVWLNKWHSVQRISD